MFKKELIEYIRKDYVELNNLEINIDGVEVKGTLYNLLTPYLAHRNTIDNFNRVISFYSRKGSKQQKLLPLYIGLSNFYKFYKEIQSKGILGLDLFLNLVKDVEKALPKDINYLGKKWKVEDIYFDISKKKHIYLTITSFEKSKVSIDRFARTINPQLVDILPNLKGKVQGYNHLVNSVEKLQNEFEYLKTNNSDYLSFLQVKSSNEKSKLGFNQIVELGKRANVKPSSGVLLFANKTKFKQLISNTYFDSKSASRTFPIAEIRFTRDMEPKVISRDESFPIVYLCSSEYYAGWEEILNYLDASYVNTIVIDDINEILKKERRIEYENFRRFSDSVLDAQKKDILKDVYLLDEDINLDNNLILEEFGIHSFPWLLNFQERNYLEGKDEQKNCHTVEVLQDDVGHRVWEFIKLLIDHMYSVVRESEYIDDKSKYLGYINNGYNLIYRATSYYDPSLRNDLSEYLGDLKNDDEYFDSRSFKSKVDNAEKIIYELAFDNAKLKATIGLIANNDNNDKIVLLSKNKNKIDQEFARECLCADGDIEVEFLNINDADPKILRDYNMGITFNFFGDHAKRMLLSKLCDKDYIVINDKGELGYYKKCFYRYTPTIISLSDFDNKLILLNLEEKEGLIDNTKIQYEIEDYLHIIESENSARTNVEKILKNSDKFSSAEDQEFGKYLSEKAYGSNEYYKHSYSADQSKGVETTFLLYYEDGFLRVSEHRYLYVLLESDDDDNVEFKKKVIDIKVGDKVFLMANFNDDFNQLLTELTDLYKPLAEHLEVANSWRYDLIVKYNELGNFYSKLNKYLKRNGIVVTNPTVERWVTGLTIVPESLSQLIDLFIDDDNSYTSQFNKNSIIAASKWLAKFRTNLHKEIFKYYVFKKYGIYDQIEELKFKDLIENIEKLVEIKEILLIERYSHANTS